MRNRGRWALGFVAAAVAIGWESQAAAKPLPLDLIKAIAAYQGFDTARATELLKAFLTSAPAPHDAATAHLYLGLVALDAVDGDTARAEFVQAVTLDPTIELSATASPKAKLLFVQAWQSVSSASNHLQSPSLAPASPPVAVSAPPEALAPPPARWPGLTVGAIGAGALVAGAILGGLSVSSLNTANDLSTLPTAANNAAHQSQTEAQVADGLLIGGAVAGVAALVLVVLEWPHAEMAAR